MFVNRGVSIHKCIVSRDGDICDCVVFDDYDVSSHMMHHFRCHSFRILCTAKGKQAVVACHLMQQDVNRRTRHSLNGLIVNSNGRFGVADELFAGEANKANLPLEHRHTCQSKWERALAHIHFWKGPPFLAFCAVFAFVGTCSSNGCARSAHYISNVVCHAPRACRVLATFCQIRRSSQGNESCSVERIWRQRCSRSANETYRDHSHSV